jgi:DNA-binding GntR family transcriptional regulator
MRAVMAEIGDASSEWTPAQVERWMESDRTFHRALMRAGGNRVMIDAAERLMTRGPMLSWTWRQKTRTTAAQTCDEHDQIIAALQARDVAAVKASVVAHIRRGRDEAIKGFEAHRLKSTM